MTCIPFDVYKIFNTSLQDISGSRCVQDLKIENQNTIWMMSL